MSDRRNGSKGRAAALALTLMAGTGFAALAVQEPVAAQQRSTTTPRAGGQLASFKSDADFLAFLQKRRAEREERMANEPPPPPAPPPPPVAASPVAESAAQADSIMVTGSRASSDKITNTQEADVDEGGIVKKRGDLLVILRRGRLFTVSIAGGQMRPVDHINAFPPGITGGSPTGLAPYGPIADGTSTSTASSSGICVALGTV